MELTSTEGFIIFYPNVVGTQQASTVLPKARTARIIELGSLDYLAFYSEDETLLAAIPDRTILAVLKLETVGADGADKSI